MSRKTLDECRTGNDFRSYVDHDPRTKEIRECGSSHTGVKGPKPGTAVLCGHGSKELPIGTRKNIIKMLIAIGLGIAILILV